MCVCEQTSKSVPLVTPNKITSELSLLFISLQVVVAFLSLSLSLSTLLFRSSLFSFHQAAIDLWAKRQPGSCVLAVCTGKHRHILLASVSLSLRLSRHSPLASIAMPSWSHRGFSSREESSGRLSLSLSPFNGIVSSFSLSFSLYSPPPPPPSISPIHIDNCHVCVYMIGEKNRNKFSKASFPVPSVGSVFVRLVVFVGLRTSSLTVCRCG